MSDPGGKNNESQKQILKSSFIIGASSLINILIGLLRMKLVAVLLGPAGVGLIGLLNNLMSAGATFAAVGVGNSGTRQIAEANQLGDSDELAIAKVSLFWCSACLAIAGGLLFYMLRAPLAEWLLDDKSLADQVGWLSVGVVLLVVAGSQRALLTGLRRIGDIAKMTILASVVSTVAGLVSLYVLGDSGIILFVLSVPLATLLVSTFYVGNQGRVKFRFVQLKAFMKHGSVLIRLGAGFMVAGAAILLGQLAVRAIIQNELGETSLGYFQAAWSISMTYIGFVLAAMGTDYFPRLTDVIKDHSAARELVNHQTEVALLLAGPVLIAMLAFTPWVIQVLYTNEFMPASSILRWQILGDVLKVLSWPLGFVIVASGKAKVFMFTESFAITVFVAASWLLLPYLQVEATGVAFLLMYVCYLPLVLFFARRLLRFEYLSSIKKEAAALIFVAIVVAMLGWYSVIWAAVLGGLAFLFMAMRSMYSLSKIADLQGPTGKLVRRFNFLGRGGL